MLWMEVICIVDLLELYYIYSCLYPYIPMNYVERLGAALNRIASQIPST